MTLPNFVIVGAMKAGTSSFALTLRHHPQIFLPRKEVHFFDSGYWYSKGLDHYASYFAGANGALAIGEKTPTYSIGAEVPERMHKAIPNAKLIWVFREPVARAYSHYWFFVSKGKEPLSFKEALAREAAGETTDRTMHYRDRSAYAAQVERFLAYYPRENMLFLLFEDLVRDHHAVLKRTCEFLGVDPDFRFSDTLEKENATKIPRSQIVQSTAYRLFHKKGIRVLRWITAVNRRLGAEKYPPMDAEIKAELRAFYAPHNARLAEITGLDVSVWGKR